MDPVVIVGGGISGLTTAFYLNKAGIRNALIEASGRLGGLIRTDRLQGCDLEAGPDSFITSKPAVIELARDLGIDHKLISSNDRARKVFIVRNNMLIPMPQGMSMMVPADWNAVLFSSLFSNAAKLRYLNEVNVQPRTREGDFSIRELILDHFGEENLQYITEPLLSGVYGGDAASLSARSVLPKFVDYETSYGSLIKGVRMHARTGPEQTKGLFQSFQGGMQTLVDTLVEQIGPTEIMFDTVQAVEPGGVTVGGKRITASHVVLACPAYQSAKLLRDSNPKLSGLLADIPYSSSILATFLFEKAGFDHPLNGFGFLVPPPERKTIAAATWINTKFPSRVAPGVVAIRAFLVDPEAGRYADSSDRGILAAVLADLQSFMRISAVPVQATVVRWPRSMPQYTVGHQSRVAAICAELANLPGLHLVSNFLDGVGIPDSVRHARTVAAAISI